MRFVEYIPKYEAQPVINARKVGYRKSDNALRTASVRVSFSALKPRNHQVRGFTSREKRRFAVCTLAPTGYSREMSHKYHFEKITSFLASFRIKDKCVHERSKCIRKLYSRDLMTSGFYAAVT